VAGTVYVDATSQKPLDGITVIIFDSANATFSTSTNCAGNFYVPADQFVPSYPIWVTIRGGLVQRDMTSAAYREGSCAGCHTGSRSSTSPGRVYLIDDPTLETPPPSRCR
jgi:hypothetical protein